MGYEIVFSVLSIIKDILIYLYKSAPNSINKFRLKKFFGPSVLGNGNFWFVVDPYEHPLPRMGNRYIKNFLGRKPNQPLIGEDKVFGSNILRLLSYSATTIGHYRDTNIPITFTTDEEIAYRWDGSMICFGSSDSNIKTYDIENFPENTYYKFKTDPATKLRYFEVSGKDYKITPTEDVAIIMRLKNPKFQNNWLFVCAGLGEWGSTGATRYLFFNWKKFHKKFRGNNFIVVVKVHGKNDENVEELFSLGE